MEEVSRRMLVLLVTAVFVFGTADTSQEFRCRSIGEFVIPDSCQEYHLCEWSYSERRLRYSRMRCPEEEIYDDQLQMCVWPSLSHRICPNIFAPTEAGPPEIERADSSQEFRCTDSGKFLIADSCQEYHLCESTWVPFGYSYSRRRCAEGEIYDDEIKDCVWSTYSRRICPNTVAPTEAAPPEIERVDTSQEFRCISSGKFLIADSCQEYHLCRWSQGGFRHSRRRCAEGKIYDDERNNCVWPTYSLRVCPNTVAPTEAAPPEIITTETSVLEFASTEATLSENAPTEAALTLDSCGNIQEIIPEIITTSNEICPYIHVIKNYVNKLISGSPIEIHYITDVEHIENITSYNAALVNAQSEVNILRNGNDFLTDIKRTYNSVKNYEANFDHNYQVNVQQMSLILSLRQATNSRLLAAIEGFKEDIQMIETETTFIETYSGILKVPLNKEIANKQHIVRTLENTLKEASGHEPEFEQLEAFLGTVTKTAKDVENTAKETQSKIDEWYTTVLITSSDLKSQSVKIDQVQKKINDDIESFKATIDKYRENIRKFNSQKNHLTSSKSKLENKVEANLKKVIDADAVISKKTLDHEMNQRRICETKGVFEIHNCSSTDDSSCGISSPLCLFYTQMYLPPLDLTEDQVELEQLKIDINEQNQILNDQINKIMIQLEVIQTDIDQKQADISEHSRNIQQKESEQTDLSLYSNYQREVWLAEDSALSAIEAIKSELQKVDCTFHTIHEGLDRMAARARTAQGAGDEHEEDVLRTKESIVQYIEELLRIIDQSSDSVNPLSCL